MIFENSALCIKEVAVCFVTRVAAKHITSVNTHTGDRNTTQLSYAFARSILGCFCPCMCACKSMYTHTPFSRRGVRKINWNR
eukprot:m.1561985 g.1561985  ORF g.1561985 m.1561985 type:complete len:82 (+) comp25279_c0_seq4:70-315(+)